MASLWRRVLVVVCALAAATTRRVTAKADFAFTGETLTRLAFGSCHKNKYANNVWKTIQEKSKPQLWIWSGDAVYPPTRGVAPLSMMQKEYDQMKTNATVGYNNFAPPLGIFGTWDDHDYGANDAGVEHPDKLQRAQQFWEFLGQSNPPENGQREGLYSSVTIGEPPRRQVKVIMLDTRWHRQKHCIPSIATMLPLGAGLACLSRWIAAGLLANWCPDPKDGPMLGQQQWEWLEQELAHGQDDEEAPAVTLVVSSVQVLTTNPAMEGWGHFPAERQRFISLLNSASQKSLVYLLSGDVHHAELLAPHPTRPSFIEVTSSGLTHSCAKHVYGGLCKPLLEWFHRHRYARKDNYYIGKNYGTLSVDWEKQTAEIQIHDLTGDVVLTTGAQSFTNLPQPLTEEQIQAVPAVMDNHLWPLLSSFLIAFAVTVAIGMLLTRSPSKAKR